MTYLGNTVEISMYYGAKPEIIKRARELRKNMTEAEKKLWLHLRKKKLMGLKFRKQHPIDTFIADFYCHECRLVIEVDGAIHNSKEANNYDSARNAEMERFGINILRFSNDQVMKQINLVINTIKDFKNTHSLPAP